MSACLGGGGATGRAGAPFRRRDARQVWPGTRCMEGDTDGRDRCFGQAAGQLQPRGLAIVNHTKVRSAPKRLMPRLGADRTPGKTDSIFGGFLAFWLARKPENCKLRDSGTQFEEPYMRDRGSRATETDCGHLSSLNFKVDPEFKKIFKGFAVSQGMTMVDLLKEGFALSQQKRGK